MLEELKLKSKALISALGRHFHSSFESGLLVLAPILKVSGICTYSALSGIL